MTQDSRKKLSVVTRAFIENSTFIKHFLRRFLHSQQDIEDVAQQAYLKAYCAEQVKAIEHPKSYLFTIAKNIAVNELTKKSNKITEYLEECDDSVSMASSTTVESEVEAEQSLGIYCDAVAALPQTCRRVFLLRRVHGLKQREIAEVLGVSLRNVEMHLQKGTLKCREFVRNKQKIEGLTNDDWQNTQRSQKGRKI
ncbi:RNA polymerase sigma factor [Shewanella intestini]|uniref:RNA polymerase sigma factor n=1 Tax=Shewanella intestini TaxID=2017544 RepID=A0ABS5I6N9_9GAMM|nr:MULTISPECIES: RNA polymerase sigma factor [Shewanella]MBR9728990.1 RNA polymerase sigma factor [Shewanella intestini]MRG36944.1 sigma-70 family RNA polymerase sigma factor [Shewanella sp. XMDDZSB0408]